MGRLNRLNHIGSQTLAGLVLLATASTTTMGTTQNFESITAGYGYPATTSYLQERAVAESNPKIAKLPKCTPGFSCKAPKNEAARVSRREALQFALLLGAGNSR
ncbi:hypothetical protein [Sedimenticola selenatireducens]|jgi:hypothetical protein|uniref:Uncharacterized protein n=1 Tax=Sedimenticola selenatireducens TaxID=191960 RepID=A0A557SFY5_9GAMM|nr:hypothetical protein [Sedimenticola selenatireducens]TVO76319.1 hypothetical protein FHP88_07080 [Sedimenticola selenatireducens]TVT61429.1 MAG: hypothetical protein FHK78_17950 [Sedimenticola selenatireducens]